MRILVIGATKGIGAATVREGLARGHTIRAFARSADKMTLETGLEPVRGDARSTDDLKRALAGVEAVIYALGADHNLAMIFGKVTVFSKSTEALLPAMAEAGVRRLVAVTGFGASESRAAMSAVERAGHWALLGRAYDDKTRQEALVRASDLDWTLVRPVILTNGRKGDGYKTLTDPASWRNGLIARTEVAEFVVRITETPGYIHQAVVLTR